MTKIVFTDGRDERFLALCVELDADLQTLTGGKPLPGEFARLNATDAIGDVALVEADGQAVACGGYRDYAPGTAEIKRVYVRPAFRGNGYARLLMGTLEQRAAAQGYTRLILETGSMLKAAIGLYGSLGYSIIPNYGIYSRKPDSVCMEKLLVMPAAQDEE